jgi:hypothetical protein
MAVGRHGAAITAPFAASGGGCGGYRCRNRFYRPGIRRYRRGIRLYRCALAAIRPSSQL